MIKVVVVREETFEFPGYEAVCAAHGQRLCVLCARNPGNCAGGDGGGCGHWQSTGMHWDTCPNRIKGEL